jgi:hypothetical protein
LEGIVGWIGVDLDGTLAVRNHGDSLYTIGAPVRPILELVKSWLAAGRDVRIFTARASDPDQVPVIQVWCQAHLGQVLPVTATKDYEMEELWDDRAVSVMPNTGRWCRC